MNLLKAKTPPAKPGVYIYRNSDKQILYIGKAKNLRNRVKTYFSSGQQHDSKTRQLVKNIADIEYIITDNEVEALILESILIKKHRPKFNIRLRDDKNYQFIKIDYSLPIPQIYSVRNTDRNSNGNDTISKFIKGELLNQHIIKQSSNKAKYFGPYTSGLNVRNTIRLIKKIFPYCQGKKVGNRPCFNYQLHRCPGVCIGLVSRNEYTEMLKPAELFLQGKNKIIEKKLQKEMKQAARSKNYEKAAKIRDQLQALQNLNAHQKIISTKAVNQDYLGFYRQFNRASICVFIVRDGRLIGRENLNIDNLNHKNDEEVLEAFIERYYLDNTNIPREIFVPLILKNQKLLEEFLKKRFEQITNKARKITIKIPKKGVSYQLIKLAEQNAQNFFEQQKAAFEKEKTLISEGLQQLSKIANLTYPPQRIEGFDISNIQGKHAVGSMVVFTEGKPNKAQYRKFKIKTKDTPDDYAMMKEILMRRLNNNWPKADLWVIDGGRGQLGVALEVLKKLKIDIPVIALAKDRDGTGAEKIFLPGQTSPIILPNSNPAIILIQRLRDEAHRFAITYHRKIRSKELLPK